MTSTAKGWRGQPRANKFGAKRAAVGAELFDSTGEARRWQELQLLQRAGKIHDLKRQVRTPLYVGDWLVAHLVLDFAYRRDGKPVWEDFKSPATITPLWKLKAEMFRLQFGQAIEVVT